jgi:hypothetical protein
MTDNLTYMFLRKISNSEMTFNLKYLKNCLKYYVILTFKQKIIKNV